MIPLTRPVEYDKLSAKVRKLYPTPQALADRPDSITLLKYDGVCGIGVFEPGLRPRMVSRTGEDYSVSCGLLLEDVQKGLRELRLQDKTVFTMGEVWRPPGTPGCDQPTISGDFRQQRATVTDFQYRLFDMVVLCGSPVDYYLRRRMYQTLAHHCQLAYQADQAHRLGRDPVEFARTVGDGYDGIVIWDRAALPMSDAKATGGQAVKFKPNITVDVRCNGGIQGEGKHAGRLGALTFTYQGRAGSVGTGFSDQQRIDFWDMLRLGIGVAGEVIEIEAMGVTPDGSLREPRFKGIRFDKTAAD